ncbi:Epididymal-specific lipocalin-6 [Lemmus lemmus]
MWLGRLDPKQFLGPWYILAMASRAKDFMVEKDMKNIEGVLVTLTPDNKLRVLSSRQGPDGCQSTVELLKQDSRWVFENPAIGVLDYRVLGTNFKDYAVIFTQLEFGDEAFNTVELYSRTEVASYEAMKLFTKWSQGLGFCSQQQAQLRKDRECYYYWPQGGAGSSHTHTWRDWGGEGGLSSVSTGLWVLQGITYACHTLSSL